MAWRAVITPAWRRPIRSPSTSSRTTSSPAKAVTGGPLIERPARIDDPGLRCQGVNFLSDISIDGDFCVGVHRSVLADNIRPNGDVVKLRTSACKALAGRWARPQHADSLPPRESAKSRWGATRTASDLWRRRRLATTATVARSSARACRGRGWRRRVPPRRSCCG